MRLPLCQHSSGSCPHASPALSHPLSQICCFDLCRLQQSAHSQLFPSPAPPVLSVLRTLLPHVRDSLAAPAVRRMLLLSRRRRSGPLCAHQRGWAEGLDNGVMCLNVGPLAQLDAGGDGNKNLGEEEGGPSARGHELAQRGTA